MQSPHSSALEERVAALEAENVALRERLSQWTMLHAVDAAHGGAPHAVLSALEEERRRMEVGLRPVCFEAKAPDYNVLPTYPLRPHFTTAPTHPATEVVLFDGCPNDPYHPSTTPIYQTATFVQPDSATFGPYDYSRSGNPTRTAVETLMARLEGAHAAFAFSSGMAALQTLLTTLSATDAVLASADLYGGMHRLLTQVTARLGVRVVLVEAWDIASVERQLREEPRIRLLHLESPTNPLMRIVDLRALCRLAHAHGVLVSMDNTMMSPMRCTPLALGCDYVLHSGTKFLCGHSDTMCGVLCAKDPAHAHRIAFLQNAQGNALAPFDSWLLLRGLKTISIRVEKQELNAVAVALFLTRQPHVVRRLHYAGLRPTVSPDLLSLTPEAFEIHRGQCSGPSSVLSFETGCAERSHRLVRACTLFKLTVSFGSCNSLIEMPCLHSHASIPKEQCTLPPDLIRLSIGIEQIEDILADLSRAIAAAAACPDS